MSDQKILDVCGRLCPMPLVELKRAMRDMKDGETICVVSNDELFPEDISSWCQRAGHAVVDVKQDRENFKVVVKKGT